MENLVDKIIEVDFDNLEEYIFPRGYQFGLVVYYNKVKYEFLLNLNTSSKLLCLGSAAIPGDYDGDRSRPYFNRWSWSFDNYSTIYYNDPTSYVDDSIHGGWCIGTADNWYLEDISLIINKIRKNLRVDSRDLYFYGSSMGAFTSLLLGTLNRDSKVIADIPQLDVTRWYPVHYKNIKKHLLYEDDDSVVEEKYGHRLSFLSLIKRENYVPNAVLVLDVSCLDDCEMQYNDFLISLNELPLGEKANRLYFIVHGVNLGHQQLFERETINLINNVDTVLSCLKSQCLEECSGVDYENKEYILYLENRVKLLSEKNNKVKPQKPSGNVKALNSKISKYEKEIRLLKDENSKLKSFRSEVLSSSSWKITSPLRKIMSIFKK